MAHDLHLPHGSVAAHAGMDVVALGYSNYGLVSRSRAKGIEMMRDYLSPERQHVALLTIAAQRDFCLPNSPAKVGGSMAAVPPMVRLVEGFRQRGRPIIHVVRLYRCDGSNVELCNRASIEEGQRIVMPRWSAFYRTQLEEHLHGLGVTSLVISGCNFPNGPLATVYAASNRDFRIVLATDAVSGANDVALAELARIGVYLMTSDQCLGWLARDGQVAAA